MGKVEDALSFNRDLLNSVGNDARIITGLALIQGIAGAVLERADCPDAVAKQMIGAVIDEAFRAHADMMRRRLFAS